MLWGLKNEKLNEVIHKIPTVTPLNTKHLDYIGVN